MREISISAFFFPSFSLRFLPAVSPRSKITPRTTRSLVPGAYQPIANTPILLGHSLFHPESIFLISSFYFSLFFTLPFSFLRLSRLFGTCLFSFQRARLLFLAFESRSKGIDILVEADNSPRIEAEKIPPLVKFHSVGTTPDGTRWRQRLTTGSRRSRTIPVVFIERTDPRRYSDRIVTVVRTTERDRSGSNENLASTMRRRMFTRVFSNTTRLRFRVASAFITASFSFQIYKSTVAMNRHFERATLRLIWRLKRKIRDNWFWRDSRINRSLHFH